MKSQFINVQKINVSSNSEKPKAGYEYLLAYKITVPIYDYTVVFTNRYFTPNSPYHPHFPYTRTKDQMVQAARSGMQNILEGHKQQSLKSYIKLAGVSRGSLEELLKDYQAFARQNKLKIWPQQQCKREIREISEIWEILRKNPYLPDHPNFPYLPSNPEIATNLLITLINQANYLIDRLVESLKEKHKTEGGFTENLYRTRKQYRGF